MKRAYLIRVVQSLAALYALILLPATALSLELFEGNLGYEGDWLLVLDAPAMGDRVYWEDLGADVTYEVQCAVDDGFASLVLEESGITTNYVEPGLPAGFYYLRAREVHSSGDAGSWSDTGTLQVVEDVEWPRAEILSPLSGSFSAGDIVSIELEVSDDTVLHVAQFTINGKYVGTLGLKSENYKVKPSFGEPRSLLFDYEIPKGKRGSLEISVVVSDVTYKQATTSVVIRAGEPSSGKKGGKGRGKK
jgi:hypothetical protein